MAPAITPETWTILTCLSRMLNPEPTQTLACIQDANRNSYWEQLLRLSSDHWITPQLYYRLWHDPALWTEVPSEAQSYLAEIYRLNQHRNQKLRDQTIAAVSLLNSIGITPIVLKGSCQLLTLNQDQLGQRLQTDIDLLIPPAQLDDAYSCLQADGYWPAIERDGKLIISTATEANRLADDYAEHQHLAPLVKEGELASVELHRHPFARRFQRRYPLEALLARAQTGFAFGGHYKTLCCDDRAALIALHSFIHDGHHCYYELPIKLAWDWLTHCQQCNFVANDNNQRLLDDVSRALVFNRRPSSARSRRYLWLMRHKYQHPGLQKSYYRFGRLRYLIVKSFFYPNKVGNRLKHAIIRPATIDRHTG